MTGVEGVSQVLICDPCTGGEFSVGQKLLAWAKAGGNNARRQQYRQKNVGTPWESGGEHARACRVCVIYALLLPSARMKPLSPTTARGEGKVHHAQPVRGNDPPLVRATQSRRVSTRTGSCRLVLC
jgi:hypothetical protein